MHVGVHRRPARRPATGCSIRHGRPRARPSPSGALHADRGRSTCPACSSPTSWASGRGRRSARGTARVWFGQRPVQVRWFTGSQEPCESFTVTVAGGTEDGNRHAAVDLAERMLPSRAAPDRAGGTRSGSSSDRRSTASRPTATVLVHLPSGVAVWTDGCNGFSGAEFVRGRLGDGAAHRHHLHARAASPTRPTRPSTRDVGRRIDVDLHGDLLLLTAGDAVLTLRPGRRARRAARRATPSG